MLSFICMIVHRLRLLGDNVETALDDLQVLVLNVASLELLGKGSVRLVKLEVEGAIVLDHHLVS